MKKCIKFLRAIFLIPFAFIVFFVAVHQLLTIIEKRQHPTIGTTVTVNGKHMSLSILGDGNHTIVLLPGLGTAAPILDFMPLATELSKSFDVAALFCPYFVSVIVYIIKAPAFLQALPLNLLKK